MEKDKKRLLASTPLSSSDKNVLFELLTGDSQYRKDKNESKQKVIIYFIELYNKYLIPKELAEDIKNSSVGFIKYLYDFVLSGNLFDIENSYCPEDFKGNFSISTTQLFKLNDPLVDIRYLNSKASDRKYVEKVDVSAMLIKKLNKEEKYLLKSLYCDFIECDWRDRNYLREYKSYGFGCFPTINTWDALYKLNPDWYDLLYNYLTYYKLQSGSDNDLLSKTKFDREINEAEDIDYLMKKLINYINE